MGSVLFTAEDNKIIQKEDEDCEWKARWNGYSDERRCSTSEI